MIKSPFNNRSRDRKARGPYGEHRGRRDAAPQRAGASRRESATVVHPWMSLPEKLAATQAAMHELAGQAAFQCPLDAAHSVPSISPTEEKPRTTGVNIVIRKRRVPLGMIPSLATAS